MCRRRGNVARANLFSGAAIHIALPPVAESAKDTINGSLRSHTSTRDDTAMLCIAYLRLSQVRARNTALDGAGRDVSEAVL
jgi:hypothetical protein